MTSTLTLTASKAVGVEKKLQIGTNDVSVGFHTLRHTFATRAVENGMDILVLSKILGHAQPSATANTYAHIDLTEKQTAIDEITSQLAI